MAQIDSTHFTIADARLTVRFAGGEVLSAPLTAGVDTDTGDVTFRTDPSELFPSSPRRAVSEVVPVPGGPVDLEGASVAFLVAPEGTEDVELTAPWAAVREAGGNPVLVSTVSGVVQTFNHLDRAQEYPVDHLAAEVVANDFDALVLPGGVANPDYLRTRGDAVGLVGDFFAAGLPVAAICHAPWTLIEAGVVRGRQVTAWHSLRTDLVNGGALWRDEPVVACGFGPNVLVTSRGPDDLDEFCTTVIHSIAQSRAAREFKE